MFTLTAHDVREDLLQCAAVADVALKPQRILPSNGIETLAQLAKRCKDMDNRRGVVDFQYMLTIIQLSFRCAR